MPKRELLTMHLRKLFLYKLQLLIKKCLVERSRDLKLLNYARRGKTLCLPTTKSQIQRARKLIAKGFMDCCGFTLNNKGNLVGEIQEKEDCNVCR